MHGKSSRLIAAQDDPHESAYEEWVVISRSCSLHVQAACEHHLVPCYPLRAPRNAFHDRHHSAIFHFDIVAK